MTSTHANSADEGLTGFILRPMASLSNQNNLHAFEPCPHAARPCIIHCEYDGPAAQVKQILSLSANHVASSCHGTELKETACIASALAP